MMSTQSRWFPILIIVWDAWVGQPAVENPRFFLDTHVWGQHVLRMDYHNKVSWGWETPSRILAVSWRLCIPRPVTPPAILVLAFCDREPLAMELGQVWGPCFSWRGSHASHWTRLNVGSGAARLMDSPRRNLCSSQIWKVCFAPHISQVYSAACCCDAVVLFLHGFMESHEHGPLVAEFHSQLQSLAVLTMDWKVHTRLCHSRFVFFFLCFFTHDGVLPRGVFVDQTLAFPGQVARSADPLKPQVGFGYAFINFASWRNLTEIIA